MTFPLPRPRIIYNMPTLFLSWKGQINRIFLTHLTLICFGSLRNSEKNVSKNTRHQCSPWCLLFASYNAAYYGSSSSSRPQFFMSSQTTMAYKTCSQQQVTLLRRRLSHRPRWQPTSARPPAGCAGPGRRTQDSGPQDLHGFSLWLVCLWVFCLYVVYIVFGWGMGKGVQAEIQQMLQIYIYMKGLN